MLISKDGKQIMKNIFELGGPVCLQYLSGIFPQMMPNFFLGHVSATSLGAYSLGNMFINFSGFAVIAGFASNLDTHLSQAFGAKKYYRYQIVTLRNIIISIMMAFIVAFVWFFVPEYFFNFVGVDKVVSSEAVIFCRTMIIAVCPMFVCEVFHRYLSNQNIVIFPLLVNIPNIIICFCINYFYTETYGVFASAISCICSFYFIFFLFGWYILWKGTPIVQERQKISFLNLKRSNILFVGWKEIFRFGLPGIMMMMMDWGTFEINAAFAGRINDVNLATHALLAQTCTLCYMVPLGVSIATQIIVGQKLGEKKRHLSILAAKIGFLITFVCMLLALLMFYVFRYEYFHLCTNSKEIIDLGVSVIHMQICFSALDSVQCALTAILRGVGKQDVAWKFMMGYPLIGLPCGYILAFTFGWQLLGVWSGMVVAIFTVDVCLFCLLYTVDWEKEERNAINRAKEDDNEESLLDDEEEDQYSLIGVETIGQSSGMEGEGEEEDVFLKL